MLSDIRRVVAEIKKKDGIQSQELSIDEVGGKFVLSIVVNGCMIGSFTYLTLGRAEEMAMEKFNEYDVK